MRWAGDEGRSCLSVCVRLLPNDDLLTSVLHLKLCDTSETCTPARGRYLGGQ